MKPAQAVRVFLIYALSGRNQAIATRVAVDFFRSRIPKFLKSPGFLISFFKLTGFFDRRVSIAGYCIQQPDCLLNNSFIHHCPVRGNQRAEGRKQLHQKLCRLRLKLRMLIQYVGNRRGAGVIGINILFPARLLCQHRVPQGIQGFKLRAGDLPPLWPGTGAAQQGQKCPAPARQKKPSAPGDLPQCPGLPAPDRPRPSLWSAHCKYRA